MENEWDPQSTLCENVFTWPHQQDIEIPNVMAAMGDLKGKAVLDFGCGPGNYTRLIKINGAAKVVGYDISEGMLKCAREKEAKEILGIDYTSNLTPDLNGQFDLVVTTFVFPYAHNRQDLHAMCSDMARVLRPGGRLVAMTINPAYDTTPNRDDAFGVRFVADSHHADGEKMVLEIRQPPHVHQFNLRYWSKASLETAVSEAGFQETQWIKATVYGPCPVEDAPDFVRVYLEKPRFAILAGVLPE